jgi:DNA helicase-2/ATP-dependent DNA helicase PcrA
MDLKKLNNNQKAAVEAVDKPNLIFAGAGSGKTRVLTFKISYLIREGIVKPEEILAVTFTNKAADVMKQRVAALLKNNVQDMNIGTFHSICAKLLRNEIRHLGFTKNYAIYDRSDQISLIKVLCQRQCVIKLVIINLSS